MEANDGYWYARHKETSVDSIVCVSRLGVQYIDASKIDKLEEWELLKSIPAYGEQYFLASFQTPWGIMSIPTKEDPIDVFLELVKNHPEVHFLNSKQITYRQYEQMVKLGKKFDKKAKKEFNKDLSYFLS